MRDRLKQMLTNDTVIPYIDCPEGWVPKKKGEGVVSKGNNDKGSAPEEKDG